MNEPQAETPVNGLSPEEQAVIDAMRNGNSKDIAKALVEALGAELPTLAPVPSVKKSKGLPTQPDIDRQFACFLFGTMALDGCLTRKQTEDSDKIEWIIGALTKGMRAAVPGWTFGNFESLQDMYDCADWGVTGYRQHEQDKAGAE